MKPLSTNPEDWEPFFEASQVYDSPTQSPNLSPSPTRCLSRSISPIIVYVDYSNTLSRSKSTSSLGDCNTQKSPLLSRRKRLLSFLKPAALFESITETSETPEKECGDPSASTCLATPNTAPARTLVSKGGLSLPVWPEERKARSPISALWESFHTKKPG